MKALLVADRTLSESLQPALEEEGVQVDAAEQASRADFKVRTESYDAVFLDRDLLGGVGYARLLRRWGGLKAHVFVLLPGNCDSVEKVNALDSGADAYLQRPLSFEELRACFRALGRRDRVTANSVMQAHDLELDTATRRVRRAGQPIHLTPREFDLLLLLVQHQGRVVTRSTIREYLYDGQRSCLSNAIDVYIGQLRGKIDEGFDRPLILTRWGQGYLLRAQGS